MTIVETTWFNKTNANLIILKDVVKSSKFIYGFSLIYALYHSLMFYPGILYSDSHHRWNLAIELSKGGFFKSYEYLSDHHPVIPSMIMSVFYNISGEVGLFIFVQVFLFSAVFFLLIREIVKSSMANVLIVIVLFLPINSTYALFHSFDTLAAISLGFLVLSVIRLKKGKRSLTLFFSAYFLLVSFRLNAIVFLPFLVLFIISIYKKHLFKKAIYTILLFVITSLPFLAPKFLNLKKANASVVGLCFEYSNLVTLSSDPIHDIFLNKIGVSKADLKSENIEKYRHEYASNSHKILSKVKYNDELSSELTTLYLRFIYKEPLLFIKEKLKYLKYSWGVSAPLWNTEIEKWKEYEFWLPIFTEHYAFVPNNKREEFLANYFYFSNKYLLFFKPYLLFINLFVLLFIISSYRKKNNISKAVVISFITLFLAAIIYYTSFVLNSPGSHFRYFFPSLFLIEIGFIGGVSLIIKSMFNKLPERRAAMF